MRVADLVPTLALVLLLAALGPPATVAAPPVEETSEWTCHDRVCLRTVRRGEFLTFQIQSRRKASTWVKCKLK